MMRRTREAGQVLPFVALALAAVIGFAGLAIDVGYAQYVQRIQQSATDSAAIAGASELQYHTCPDPSDITTPAKTDATTNGFTGNGSITVVTVNNPPKAGSYTSNNCAVEVTIQAPHPMFLTSGWGPTRYYTTRAVAMLSATPSGPCVVTLGGTLSLNAGNITAPNCSFVADGNLKLNGNGTAQLGEAGATGNIIDSSETFSAATPGPIAPVQDPCQTYPGCKYMTNNVPSVTPCTQWPTHVSTYTAIPGTAYCGNGNNGIDVSNMTVNFPAGIYTLVGGMSGNSSTTLTGTGVTFYIPSGNIGLNNATLSLTAPAAPPSGPAWGGMLFFGPTDTSNIIMNNGANVLDGIIYFPKASLTLNNSANSYYVIIAGNATLNSNVINMPNPSSFSGSVVPVLAE